MTNETLRQALEALDALGDDAAVHIWPDDLEKCMTSECVVQVTSVRMGSPDGKTVPLFSREQVEEVLRSAIDAEQAKGREAVASSACPICGKDEVHQHGIESTAEWLRNQARRFWGAEADKFIRINTSEVGLIDALRREIKVLEARIEDLKPETSYENYCKSDAELRALRTTPPAQPAREWVGLSTEDLAGWDQREIRSARYWEAKLREKNAGQPVVKEN